MLKPWRTIPNMLSVIACIGILTGVCAAGEKSEEVPPRLADLRKATADEFFRAVDRLERDMYYSSEGPASVRNKVQNQARRIVKEMKYQDDWLACALYLRYKYPDRYKGFRVLTEHWLKTSWRLKTPRQREESYRVPGPAGQFAVDYLERFLKESVIVPWLMLEVTKGDLFNDGEQKQVLTYILNRFLLDLYIQRDALDPAIYKQHLKAVSMTRNMIYSFMVDVKAGPNKQIKDVVLEFEKKLLPTEQQELTQVADALKENGEVAPVITGPLVSRTKSHLTKDGKPVYIGGTAANTDYRDIDALPFISTRPDKAAQPQSGIEDIEIENETSPDADVAPDEEATEGKDQPHSTE